MPQPVRSASRDEILQTLLWAGVSAARSYGLLSGWDRDELPEYWITCRVAEELAHLNLYCALDRSVGKILKDCSIPTNRVAAPIAGAQGRKIDIVLYDRTSDPDTALPRGLIEIKGPRTNWQSFAEQAGRLRSLAAVVQRNPKTTQELLVAMAYVTGQAHPEYLRRERDEMSTRLRVETAKIIESPPYESSWKYQPERRWQVFVAHL